MAIATATFAAAFIAVFPRPAEAAPRSSLVSTDTLLSGTTLALKEGSRTEILRRVTLVGRIPLPRPNQWVSVTVRREGRVVKVRRVPADPEKGRFRMRVKLKGCCEYVAQAAHGADASDPLAFEATGPPDLEDPRQIVLFNRLLEENGFHMGEITDQVDESTELAIMALRKTHDLARITDYSPKLFELLLSGGAHFEPVHREDGRHVEVDISRQVMALIEDGRATDVFHVSTGAGGTPRGEWTFYDKAPGYNAKGMYYSAYYDGDYATHGYSSVPTYPASHGCTRNPLPYAVFIYYWIEIGDTIYVYD